MEDKEKMVFKVGRSSRVGVFDFLEEVKEEGKERGGVERVLRMEFRGRVSRIKKRGLRSKGEEGRVKRGGRERGGEEEEKLSEERRDKKERRVLGFNTLEISLHIALIFDSKLSPA